MVAHRPFFVWQAAPLDLGSVGLPGPGFFPLLLGASWWCSRSPSASALAAFRRRYGRLGHRDVLIAVAALLALPLIFEPLGAIIRSACLEPRCSS